MVWTVEKKVTREWRSLCGRLLGWTVTTFYGDRTIRSEFWPQFGWDWEE
jgi:hypothetical protein